MLFVCCSLGEEGDVEEIFQPLGSEVLLGFLPELGEKLLVALGILEVVTEAMAQQLENFREGECAIFNELLQNIDTARANEKRTE